MGFLAWAKRLDDRVAFPQHRLRRRTCVRSGVGFGLFAALVYVLSFFEGFEMMGRSAATVAFFAGMFLGRATEHDLAKKDLGLLPDDPR